MVSLGTALDTNHRQEVQAKVSDFGQCPMQSGLVLDSAGDESIAVPQRGNRQPLEPRAPVGVQLVPDANFVICGSVCRHR